MYICKNCGRDFEEPDVVYETHGFDYGPYEKWLVCPSCHDSNFEEAEQCDGCGEYFAKSDLTDGLCDDCYEEEEENYND